MRDAQQAYTLVETADQVAQMLTTLAEHSWVCVDTEFLRESTYFPKLCLLQLGCPQHVWCIDPLKLDNLEPIFRFLLRKDITKVLHAADQDLEIFFQFSEQLPKPVFDTQLAAPLLGYAEQIGYATLIQQALGVELDKSHTRTDWSQRPLSAAQLRYAADDVRYLVPLYAKMHDSLVARSRLEWLTEDFAELVNPKRYQQLPEEAWSRVRGASQLKAPQLAVLMSLARWRETTARNEDKPRNWVIRDSVLLELAMRQPHTTDQLREIRGLSPQAHRQHAAEIVAVIAQADRASPPYPSRDTRPAPLTLQQECLIDVLGAVVRARADQEQINSAALGGRRQLIQLVRGQRNLPILRGWRRRLVGDQLLAIISGELSIHANHRSLTLKPIRGLAANTRPDSKPSS